MELRTVYEGVRVLVVAIVREGATIIPRGDHRILAGQQVWVWLTAAYRDPSRHHDADHYTVHRGVRSPLAFGHGPHHCLGHALGLAEMTDTLRALVRRWPGMQLTAPAPITGLMMRAPRAVPVVLRPAARR